MNSRQKRFALKSIILRLYKKWEDEVILNIKLDHLKSGSELSLNEWILKQEPKSPLSEESGEPVFKKDLK